MIKIDKEKATERISFRLTTTMKQNIEKRATEEGRTESNFILNILNKRLLELDEAEEKLKNR